jgi:hypothetical protein
LAPANIQNSALLRVQLFAIAVPRLKESFGAVNRDYQWLSKGSPAPLLADCDPGPAFIESANRHTEQSIGAGVESMTTSRSCIVLNIAKTFGAGGNNGEDYLHSL